MLWEFCGFSAVKTVHYLILMPLVRPWQLGVFLGCFASGSSYGISGTAVLTLIRWRICCPFVDLACLCCSVFRTIRSLMKMWSFWVGLLARGNSSPSQTTRLAYPRDYRSKKVVHSFLFSKSLARFYPVFEWVFPSLYQKSFTLISW